MKQYYKTKGKCRKCGEVLESMHRHDFQMCHCDGQAMVDGGVANGYIRSGGTLEWITEPVSEEEFEEYASLNPGMKR